MDFNLYFGDADGRRNDDKPLASAETARRRKAKSLYVYFNLLVNEQRVCTSREYKVGFPSFQADIYEVFHINVFTMPSSIQLEVFISGVPGSKMIDLIDVEVPGLHVKALTSSSYLFKEIPFSRIENEKRRLARKKGEED